MELKKLPNDVMLYGKDINPVIDFINKLMKLSTANGLEWRNNQSGMGLNLNVKKLAKEIKKVTPKEDITQNESLFVAKVTNVHPENANQWTYDFIKLRKTALHGYDINSWRTAELTGTAFNLAEHNNDGLGVESNGVNIDNLPENFEYQPIPVGTPVLIMKFIDDQHMGSEYWIVGVGYLNGIDGVCE